MDFNAIFNPTWAGHFWEVYNGWINVLIGCTGPYETCVQPGGLASFVLMGLGLSIVGLVLGVIRRMAGEQRRPMVQSSGSSRGGFRNE